MQFTRLTRHDINNCTNICMHIVHLCNILCILYFYVTFSKTWTPYKTNESKNEANIVPNVLFINRRRCLNTHSLFFGFINILINIIFSKSILNILLKIISIRNIERLKRYYEVFRLLLTKTSWGVPHSKLTTSLWK